MLMLRPFFILNRQPKKTTKAAKDIVMKRKREKFKQDFKILVVDDDQGILNFFVRLFEGTVSLSTALSGEDAIALAGKTKYDIAFVDIRLKGMDGVEVLKQLKKIGPETTVILMSGYAAEGQIKEGFKNGAIDFLQKPFEDINKILTIPEAAKILKMDPITLRRLAKNGDLPAIKLGKQWRIRQEKLNEWLKEKEAARGT